MTTRGQATTFSTSRTCSPPVAGEPVAVQGQLASRLHRQGTRQGHLHRLPVLEIIPGFQGVHILRLGVEPGVHLAQRQKNTQQDDAG